MSDDERVFAFNGSFLEREKKKPHFAANVRFIKRDPTSLDISLLWHGGTEEATRAYSNLRPLIQRNHVWLYAMDPKQPSIEVIGITSWAFRGQIGTIEARAAEIGFSWTPDSVDNRYRVTVQLQPGAVVSRTQYSKVDKSGGLKTEYGTPGNITIQTSFGPMSVQQSYQHGTSSEFGDAVSRDILRATISGDLVVPAGTAMHDAHDRLRLELDQVCSVLALCFRQPVRYYEIQYVEILAGRDGRESLYRARWSKSRAMIRNEVLIHADRLVSRGLQRLVTAARAHSKAEAIFRAMEFIAASYEVSEEVGFFMTFSAMETVLNAAASRKMSQPATTRTWKPIEGELARVMEACARRLTIDLSSEIKRLPNLRGVSFANRIADTCARLKPETKDLWPREIGFMEGMASAARLRNDLFHGSKANDELYAELVRVRTFAERLVLKLLKWPDDRLWVWRDDVLGRINYP